MFQFEQTTTPREKIDLLQRQAIKVCGREYEQDKTTAHLFHNIIKPAIERVLSDDLKDNPEQLLTIVKILREEIERILAENNIAWEMDLGSIQIQPHDIIRELQQALRELANETASFVFSVKMGTFRTFDKTLH